MQQSTVDDISVLAKLIGHRSNAALTFNDQQLAIDNLASLENHPSIYLSCLYDSKGYLFVSYLKQNAPPSNCKLTTKKENESVFYKISNNQLILYNPIFMDNEFRGSVLIKANLNMLHEHFIRNLIIALLIGSAVVFLALILASKFQQIISKPLINLTDVAKQISNDNDYSARAIKSGNDEIGELVDTFNSMLSTIASQNEVLVSATNKANAANAVKSQFLANMSHELRTPINGVIGMNDLLMTTELNEEQKEYAELTAQSGKVLLDTVNQILDLASIEGVGLILNPQQVTMHHFIDDIIHLFSSQLASQKLDLIINMDENIPYQLNFDPIRMRQIFINLIANAIKFTKQGAVIVSVNWKNGYLHVTIEDTGVGIPLEAQEIIFESFQQADNSSTRAFGGTGLGLAISQQICHAMQGTIKLVRSSDKGSLFSFNVLAQGLNHEKIQSVDFDYSEKIFILSQSILGVWLKEVFEKQAIQVQLIKNISELLLIQKEAAIVFVDDYYEQKEITKLIDYSIEIKQRIILLSWVGEHSKKTVLNSVELLYKPITVSSLDNLLSQFASENYAL